MKKSLAYVINTVFGTICRMGNKMFRRLLKMVRRGKYEGSLESELYGPLESWDVSRVTDMSYAFANMRVLVDWTDEMLEKLDLSKWDTSNVTTMSGMFWGATSFRGVGIGSWNTGNVLCMSCMFYGARSFRGDGIGTWDTGKVTDMSHMFCNATSFQGDGIGAWNTSKVTDMSWMFRDATNFRGDGIGAWNTGKVSDMSYMFDCATSFRGDGIGAWNTSKVTDMAFMFRGATNFRGDRIGAWNTRNVTNMARMFCGATNFCGKGIGDWVISPKLTNAKGMFAYTRQFNEPIRWTQPQGASPLSPPSFAQRVSHLSPPTTPPAAATRHISTQGMFYEATAFEFHETLPPRGAAQDDQALHRAVHIHPVA